MLLFQLITLVPSKVVTLSQINGTVFLPYLYQSVSRHVLVVRIILCGKFSPVDKAVF